MPSTYTLIKGETLASSAASYTFTAIPSTFTDLVVRASIRSNYAGTLDFSAVTLNATTTGSLYSNTFVGGYSDGVESGRDSNLSNPASQTTGGAITGNTATSNTFASFELYLPLYAGTATKAFSTASVAENNSAASGESAIRAMASLFRNTAGITEIKLAAQTGTNLLTGSSFYLYGVKSS
jgi:hypothetical protein